jgi:2-oxoglutarate ferredoxin oxidoreductase subunit beta
MGTLNTTIGVFPVGCAVFGYDYFKFDGIQASHGRAPAVATGAKRAKPDRLVFTYQGDGDMAAIGTAEVVHAAARGENITAIFVNNAIYGMTGGQMAPTTMPGQKTQTTPFGRDTDKAGFPLKVCEMFATIDGVALAERVSVHDAKHIAQAKKAIKKAFEMQLRGEGFTLVEILSNCPTNWALTPTASIEWLKDNMIPYYPLGVYKEGSVR